MNHMENIEAARIAREQERAAAARNRHHGRMVTDDYAGCIIASLEREAYDEAMAGMDPADFRVIRKATIRTADYAAWANAVLEHAHPDDVWAMPSGYFARREVVLEWARGESVAGGAWRLHEVVHAERERAMT
jgi:hypothetical protein